MKKDFFDYMYKLMKENLHLYMIFAGLGYPRYDEFKKEYPNRVINTEASEQTALDIAVGLSLSGKLPVVYTITPFYWRAAETIRYYFAHENLPIIMCGAGRDDDYSKGDGFSHDAADINILMDGFKIPCYWPNNKEELFKYMDKLIKYNLPSFLSLRR